MKKIPPWKKKRKRIQEIRERGKEESAK